MRTLRLSRSYYAQLADYLADGEAKLGLNVVEEKRARIISALEIISQNPRLKRRNEELGLVVYPVKTTPFFIVYDYDDAEVRVLYIFINGKPLDGIDASDVEW